MRTSHEAAPRAVKRFDCPVDSDETSNAGGSHGNGKPGRSSGQERSWCSGRLRRPPRRARRRKQEVGLAETKADYLARFVLGEDTDDVPE